MTAKLPALERRITDLERHYPPERECVADALPHHLALMCVDITDMHILGQGRDHHGPEYQAEFIVACWANFDRTAFAALLGRFTAAASTDAAITELKLFVYERAVRGSGPTAAWDDFLRDLDAHYHRKAALGDPPHLDDGQRMALAHRLMTRLRESGRTYTPYWDAIMQAACEEDERETP